MIKKLNEHLHTPNWLFIVLTVVLILRIPNFFEPYSYGDEMIYLTLGEGVRKGVTLYSEIHDNKPPLLYLTAALAGNLLWFKAFLAIWSLITIYLFWKLAELLFPKNLNLQKLATLVFAFYTTVPRLEGHIANAENFMIGFTIAGFLLLFRNGLKKSKLKPKRIMVAGIMFSIATLFKVPAMFDIGAVLFLWLTLIKISKKEVKKLVINTAYLMIGFLVPIVLTMLWYYIRGALQEYLVAAFLQNVGYLSSWRPDDVKEPFLTKNGPLLLRALIVFLGHIILYLSRKKLTKQFLFISSWLLLSLFAVTLSERPYPHYLLQSITPISLLVAILVFKKDLEQSLAIIPLTLTFFVPVYFNFWHYSTVDYYTRFINLATNNISKEEYIDSFGSHVRRNYNIAGFLASSTKENEKVFVWGDGSSIYALSGRLPPIKYVADYHIRDFSSHEEVINKLMFDMPKMVVVLPNSPPFPDLDRLLSKNYGLSEQFDGATVWILLSSNVRALLSL